MLTFVRANKNNPFFLYYPTVIPHLALQAPEQEIATYKGKWPETPTPVKAINRIQHHFLLWDFAGYGGQLAVRIGTWI